jgi:hypothetical protein
MTKIDCGGITIITFTDGIAEIIINNPTVKPPVSADELVRLLIANNVFAAKIIRIQTAKESPPPRFVTQQESGPVTS